MASGRFRPHRLVASSPEGQLSYIVREGPVTAEVFREFLEQIAEEADRKILFVADNCRMHRARIIPEWLATNQAARELCWQPTYSPRVNPVERLEALVQLRANLEAACHSWQGVPEQVPAFWREAGYQHILG